MAKKLTKLQRSELFEAKLELETAITSLENVQFILSTCKYDYMNEYASDIEDILTTLNNYNADINIIVRGGDT